MAMVNDGDPPLVMVMAMGILPNQTLPSSIAYFILLKQQVPTMVNYLLLPPSIVLPMFIIQVAQKIL